MPCSRLQAQASFALYEALATRNSNWPSQGYRFSNYFLLILMTGASPVLKTERSHIGSGAENSLKLMF